MTNTINDLILYLKNPVLEKDKNNQFVYRFKTLINLLFISIVTTFVITFITGFFELSGLLDSGKHSIEEVMKNYSTFQFFLIAVVLAPLIEESIFRAPLTLFKNPKIFKIAFYTLALLFGYMHIFNFEITLNILLFSPILVAPQISEIGRAHV